MQVAEVPGPALLVEVLHMGSTAGEPPLVVAPESELHPPVVRVWALRSAAARE